jgi:hypothetical protein
MEQEAGGLSVEQVCSLPLGVQLQLLVLECLTLLLPHLQPGANLPPSLYHQLLGQVLEHSHLSGRSPAAGSAVLELACKRMRSTALQVLSHCTAVARRARGVARPLASDVLHSCLLERFKLALTDCSNSQGSGDGRHTACADVLCLLGDYLRACDQPQLANTACFMLGPVLVQQEHMLRAVRMELWSWAAMQHMDGLVRVYAALMAQATCPAAMVWLLKAFGVAGSSSGGAGGVPADTLQLVLDYLLKHLTSVAAAITHSFGGAVEQAAAAGGSSGGGSLKQQDGGLSPATPSSARSAARMAGHMLAAAGLDLQSNAASTHVTQMKAHCWQLLAALLQLALRGADLMRTAGGSQLGGFKMMPVLLHGGPTLCACCRPRALDAAPPAPAGVPGTASGAVLSPSLWRGLTGGSEGAAPGCCRVWQLLVDLLMMHSKAGQAVVLQQLADTNGGRLLLPLQHAVRVTARAGCLLRESRRWRGLSLNASCHPPPAPCCIWPLLLLQLVDFLAVALGAPDAYPYTRPQLAEFFVHHHFLHFTQHYHKLPTSPTLAAANCCKGHAKVGGCVACLGVDGTWLSAVLMERVK